MAPGGVPRSEDAIPRGSLWKVHCVLLLVQCGYGAGYVLSKFAVTTAVNPVVFALYRDAIAVCTVGPVAYFAERGKRRRIDLSTAALLVILGVAGVCCGQILLLFGLKLAGASLSSVISISIPVCVFFITAVLGLEEINWRRPDGKAKVGGLILAVVGGVLIAVYRGPAILGVARPPDLNTSSGSGLQVDGIGTSPLSLLEFGVEGWQIGVIFFFLSGLALSIAVTLQIPILKKYPAPFSLTALAYAVGVLAIGLVGLVTVKNSSEWIIDQPAVLLSGIYGGIITSGANFAFQAWVTQKAGPVLVATYIPAQPFVTSTIALIFLGESIHLGSLMGTLVIISGLCLITWGKMKGGELGARSIEAAPTPDGLLAVKPTSNLEEPLLG